MLGLALRGASALSKAGKGAQMAKAITGRKKKPEPGVARPGGGEGGGGGGSAIIKAKVVSAPASALVPVKKSPNVQQGMGSGIISILETIRANVKEIDDFYKGTVAAKREEIKKRKKQESDERKAEQETKLEKPKIDKKPKDIKGLKMPRTGILDGIFRFISNVLMGMLVMKLIDFADALEKSGILPLLGKIGDFILDIGGKILNGLITFIDKGYELYDGLRKSIGDTFGEGAQEQFDKLAGTLNKVLNTVFSVGLAISLLAGAIPQKKPKAKTPKPKPKTKVDTKLKKMGLDDDQIKAYKKAREAGAGASDALKQAKKVKPKAKPKGFFGRLGEGFQKAGEGLGKLGQNVVDVGKSGLRAIGGGLNKISGGNLGKLGNFLGEQYNNVSKGARAAFDRVAGLGSSLKSKFGSAMESVKGAIGNVAESAKKAIMQKIIEPIKPFLEPIIKKAQSIGKNAMDLLKKIPGFDNILQVLKKKGINSIGDAAGILKRVGSKALPIVGALFNLLFAYDRLAGGDTFGALLETLSAGFDILPLLIGPPGAFGPGVSMGIDAYMFARDFVPLIQEGEEKVIGAMGLGGLKSNLDKIASKLPDLGTIVAMFQGKNVEQKSAAEVASTTTGSTTTTDGSTPAPAASSTPATTTTTTTTPTVTPEEQGDASEAAQRILKDFPQIATRASSPQIYASGLGFYLKKVGAGEGGKGDFGDPYGAPHGGMEHPDHGGIVGTHAGTGHDRGVAVDLGGNSADSGSYQDDQKKLWPFIVNYMKKYGLNKEPYVPQVIHGTGESFSPRKMDTIGPDAGHRDHFHVEFEGGGYVGGKYNMRSLERRASYEGGEQMIDIPIPMPQQSSTPPEPEMIPSGSGSFSADFKDDFEFLEFQG